MAGRLTVDDLRLVIVDPACTRTADGSTRQSCRCFRHVGSADAGVFSTSTFASACWLISSGIPSEEKDEKRRETMDDADINFNFR
jgi:hypothetical protein